MSPATRSTSPAESGAGRSSTGRLTSIGERPDEQRKCQFRAIARVLARHRVQTCRRELLNRTLIWNQAHLLHALREFEQFYNRHRPHQGIANVRPLRALPAPVPELVAATCLHVRRRDRLGGILHEYHHAA